MKRILAGLFALIILCSAASCGDGQTEKEPFAPVSAEEAERRAEEILADMTLEEKVGQLFIARYPMSNAREEAEKYHLGGYTMYNRDFILATPKSVRRELLSLQGASKVPMLIAVDEEGGEVVRISDKIAFRDEPFASPAELYREGGIERCVADAREKSNFLLDLGINLNLAPVCDMSYSSENYIYDRTLGRDAETTSEYVSALVAEMNACGIGSALKHFPGYGDNLDTHLEISYDKRTLEEFMSADLLPFRAGIEAGAGIVLVSHNIVECLDGERPASISPRVLAFLRDELGFDDVIMTDSLDMGGITQFTGEDAAAVAALKAGADLLCCTAYAEGIAAILEALENGEVTEERLDASVRRLLKLKVSLGIIK